MVDWKTDELLHAKALLEKQVRKHIIIFDVVKALSAETSLDHLLTLITEETTRVMEADRSTLFLLDPEKGELWSKVAQGLESQVIRMQPHEGIVGYAISTDKTVNIPDAYEDPRFNPEVDRQTGYRTRNILCMPVRTKEGKTLGALQILNKREGIFTTDDEELLRAISAQAAIALENARLYEDLRRANLQLKELDRLKSDFLANISHELRTPLAPIIGYLEVLLTDQDPLTPRQHSGLTIISEAVDRLAALIEDLLAFVQIDRGEIALHTTPVSLASVIEAKLALLEKRAETKGTTLTTEIPPDLPPVLADSEAIGKVLFLLLDNAIKFTPGGGRVTAGARPGPGATVEIFVRDTGIGIPPAETAKIFDRFYQVDSSPTREYGGTGLGLAVVKQIVEAHGSRITVESTIGEGSTFCFTLPAASGQE